MVECGEYCEESCDVESVCVNCGECGVLWGVCVLESCCRTSLLPAMRSCQSHTHLHAFAYSRNLLRVAVFFCRQL